MFTTAFLGLFRRLWAEAARAKCPQCHQPFAPEIHKGEEITCLDGRMYCRDCLRSGACGCARG